MKNVDLTLHLTLDDDVAEWIESKQGSLEFSSDVAYYFEQKLNGGFVLTKDKLDTLLDEVVDSLEDDGDDVQESGEVSANLQDIESSMRKVLLEVLEDKDIMSVSTTKVSSDVEEDEDDEEDVATSRISIFSNTAADESESTSEDDLGALADMFSF